MAKELVEVQDIPLVLEESDVWNCLGSRDRVVPALADEVRNQTEAGRSLCTPRALYRRIDVKEIRRDEIVFDGDITLDGKFLAHLFTGAQEAVFLIATIGPEIEEMVSQMFTKGESVEAVVLDAVGSAAIMSVFGSVLNRIYEDTTERDWVTGTCLRPGQSYWDITGQASIFQALNGNEIGVELLESSFMRPQKSQSAVVPIGPDLKVHGDPNQSYCRYCQATRCPMRTEPQVTFHP